MDCDPIQLKEVLQLVTEDFTKAAKDAAGTLLPSPDELIAAIKAKAQMFDVDLPEIVLKRAVMSIEWLHKDIMREVAT